MTPTFCFSDKHVLITGASSGIGQQNTWDLSETGAKITAIGRDRTKLNFTKSKVKFGTISNFQAGDLCDSDFLDELTKNIREIDGLVLCAGAIDYTPSKMITAHRIKNVFAINFDANVLLIRALLKNKKIKNGASIVIISSISSKLGVGGTALYAASKAAIAAYAKVLATELAPQRIRVNVIHPGIVETNIITTEGVVDNDKMKSIRDQYPLGFGSTKDVSNQIMHLLSEGSRWITGSEFIIDGGHTITR